MTKEKIRIAVVGYGNIGKFLLQAVQASSDMEIAAVVRRDVRQIPKELTRYNVVSDLADCKGKVDVAILCIPSRLMSSRAEQYLNMGIVTVDSFDIHSHIVEHRCRLDRAAKDNSAVAVVAAGWDPGTDSVIRVLMQAMAPQGITYTNFGPGMSMGHTVAAKAVDGVKDALSLTLPLSNGLHRRMVYVELEEGADFEQVASAIKKDAYFVHDETFVTQVNDVLSLRDMGHGVLMERKGVSGSTQNQRFSFRMSVNNPALTAQIMVGAARAAMHLQPGAYTLIEIPPVYLLPGKTEEWVGKLV